MHPRPSISHLASSALVAVILVCRSAAEKDNTVKLTKFNFENNMKNGAWFVKFYAPWCTHCQRLAPIWEKLADLGVENDWAVKIAEVDCTSTKDICEKINVKAFPTLMLIKNGAMKGKYQGEASVQHFEAWLSKHGVLKAGQESVEEEASTAIETPVTGTSRPTEGAQVSSWAAATALLQHRMTTMFGKFPTQSKIINVYFYGFSIITTLVFFLMVLFNGVEEEERLQDSGHQHQD